MRNLTIAAMVGGLTLMAVAPAAQAAPQRPKAGGIYSYLGLPGPSVMGVAVSKTTGLMGVQCGLSPPLPSTSFKRMPIKLGGRPKRYTFEAVGKNSAGGTITLRDGVFSQDGKKLQATVKLAGFPAFSMCASGTRKVTFNLLKAGQTPPKPTPTPTPIPTPSPGSFAISLNCPPSSDAAPLPGGQPVTVTGQLTPAVPGAQIAVQVVGADPQDAVVPAQADGTFSHTFTPRRQGPAPGAQYGTTVSARYQSGPNDPGITKNCPIIVK